MSVSLPASHALPKANPRTHFKRRGAENVGFNSRNIEISLMLVLTACGDRACCGLASFAGFGIDTIGEAEEPAVPGPHPIL
jgi:hypothetical protein